MNKFIIALAVVAAVVVGWYLFMPETIDYVSVVETEVAALETELASLEAQVTAGTLSPAGANEARARIIARIDSITEAAEEGGKAKLTDSQRLMLQTGLTNLKDTLIRYQSTLVAVDTAAEIEAEAETAATLNRGGNSSNRSLSAIVAGALEEIEESVAEIIEDFFSEEELIELVEGTDESATSTEAVDDDMSGEMDDETGSSTDEVSDDSGTSTEETTDDSAAEEDASTSSDMSIELDSSASLEAETGDDATEEETIN